MTNALHCQKTKGKNDECYTERYAVEPLLEYLKPFRDKIIWCPFSTAESEFVKVFLQEGIKVIFSHIDYGQDFYTYEPEQWDIMIDNPPFTGKTELFKRAISFNKPFALLMRVDYLNDGVASKTFRENDIQLLSFDKRMQFKNKPKGNISYMCGYFCRYFLRRDLIFSDFKNRKQQKLRVAV